MQIKSHNRFNFGKYRGMAVSDVALFDPSYIDYCERSGHVFTNAVKRTQRVGYERSGSTTYKPRDFV